MVKDVSCNSCSCGGESHIMRYKVTIMRNEVEMISHIGYEPILRDINTQLQEIVKITRKKNQEKAE